MDSETYKRQKAFAGELQPSMQRRCLDHDYSGRSLYMVTMVVEGRRPFFGRVVGNCEAPPGTEDAPRIELTELGKRVRGNFLAIAERHPEIGIIALQMMPDHLHGILHVKERMEVHLGQAIAGFKSGCNKDYRELVVGERLVAAGGRSVAAMPQQTGKEETGKEETGKEETGKEEMGEGRQRPPRSAYDRKRGFLFASGYNDKIMFRREQLGRWLNYLADNPRRLLMKRTHPEWLRPHFDVKAGGYTFAAIGNLELLRVARRLQVRVSRRCSAVQVAEEVSRYLSEARAGAVLISPAISPGEKAVMRAAFDAGLPMVVLVENGFTPLTKPRGEQFDACGAGRLLLLAPWEHHNDKRKITGQQCQALNLMATALCR